jgi:hypothetical protein
VVTMGTPAAPQTPFSKDVTMRFLLASLSLLAFASPSIAAHIGNPNFAGYPIEIVFMDAPTLGVAARAFGDLAWTPVDVTDNTASFTAIGLETGQKFGLLNQETPTYYTQFQKLYFMQQDSNEYVSRFTETGIDLVNMLHHFTLTIPSGPTVDNRVVPMSFPVISLPASVPEPTTALLSLLGIPALHWLSRSTRFCG